MTLLSDRVLAAPVPALAHALRSRAVSSVELVEAALHDVAATNAAVAAFVAVDEEGARAQARRADEERAQGIDRGPMHGLPVAVKDVIDVAGLRTSCQSNAQGVDVADVDAPLVANLRDAGAVLLGKLNTHEFALGGPDAGLPFPPARNPWDLDRVPGASSSGAGAGIALRLVKGAVGTDTSGSIRNPAAHCGVYGLKPTFGVVPRAGVFPLSFSLDHCGPLVASAVDLEPMLDALTGRDVRDPSSISGRFRAPVRGLRGLRVGYARDFFADDPAVDPEVLGALDGLAAELAVLGASVVEVSLAPFAEFNAVGRVLMSAESFAIHEESLARQPERYGRYTYERILPGAVVGGTDLLRAMQLRRSLAARTELALRDVDVVLTANALCRPARFDEFGAHWPPGARMTATRTIAFNVSGHPALAVPIGLSSLGLPLSAQLVARVHGDRQVIETAVAMEQAGLTGLAMPEVAPWA